MESLPHPQQFPRMAKLTTYIHRRDLGIPNPGAVVTATRVLSLGAVRSDVIFHSFFHYELLVWCTGVYLYPKHTFFFSFSPCSSCTPAISSPQQDTRALSYNTDTCRIPHSTPGSPYTFRMKDPGRGCASAMGSWHQHRQWSSGFRMAALQRALPDHPSLDPITTWRAPTTLSSGIQDRTPQYHIKFRRPGPEEEEL